MTHKRNTSGLIKNPPRWKSDPRTKAVRIPLSLVDEVLELAHQIDEDRANHSDTDNASTASQYKGDKRSIHLTEIIVTLNNALTMKANAGGAIKAEIRKVLKLLEEI